MSPATPLSDLYQLFRRSAIPSPMSQAQPHQLHQPGAVRASTAWAWADPAAPIRPGAQMLPTPLPLPFPVPSSAHSNAPAPRALPTTSVSPASPAQHITAPATGERREVRMAPALVAAMTAAAAASGRHESEIWAEAAREWLARHTPDDDPPPPPPGASQRAPFVRTARERCWGAIDVLLGDLRHPYPQPAFTSLIDAADPIDPAA